VIAIEHICSLDLHIPLGGVQGVGSRGNPVAVGAILSCETALTLIA